MELTGIHHLTAISAAIKENDRFYTQTLGMRLVKRSVNQDDVSAYTYSKWELEGRMRSCTSRCSQTCLSHGRAPEASIMSPSERLMRNTMPGQSD